ncbi:roadblock/LC7 domain-containing protein [Demequina flava]|uniref:roadblock/LC7 domain-containing protein n=1 Tax=Demequina flava TaxID=1095025 RepID=UPI000786287B|nr:roadblock/LC7 domain-containing protein [Demequina flava]
MIDRQHVESLVAPLRECDDVERVIVATADGIAYVDDATLVDRERGAASVASLMGVVELTARSLGVADLQGAVIHGREHEIISRTVAEAFLIVVVARRGDGRDSVYRELRRAAAAMENLVSERAAH